MKTVIIAEKPSVAKSIAAIVGANTRMDGYMEGNGYMVTWAFGHLVGLALPEEYGFKGFNREHLPILPNPFILKPRQIKEGKEYKPDAGAVKQLEVIRRLFAQTDRIVSGVDAGREGELIFRYIYHYLGCTKPFDRLWISSLTDKAIREGLQNLRPGKDYDKLYASAKARSEADYLIGINASQSLSIAAGRGVWSLGRVQTPTLAIICSRYLENKAFTPATYFKLKLQTTKDATTFAVLSVDKYDERKSAEETVAAIMQAANVRVENVERKEQNVQPPLPYDLTTLQKEANSRYGFTAERTLSIAQSLYESKHLTYPRTSSHYISTDIMEEVPELIAKFKEYERFAAYARSMDLKILNIRPVDDKKISDHHAILPTENLPGKLSDEERTIYEMVAGRMLEAFSPVCKKANTVVKLKCGETEFTARGSETLSPGWQKVFGYKEEEQEEDTTILPEIKEGEILPVNACGILEKQTKPCPIHTESTLLAAMETCAKRVENEAEREAIKECGIGTPATRAAIIETLFARDYIRREKKSLVPTEKGLTVYGVVKDKMIADVAMTGGWELALSKIESGEMEASSFHKGIEVHAAQITTELLNTKIIVQDDKAGCACPRCKTGHVVFYPKVAKCGNGDCNLMVFREIAKKSLTDKQLSDLLVKGKTSLISGFQSKAGKSFDAMVTLDNDFKTTFVFPERKADKKWKSKK
ncbi:type IA DNA topoisomerase [Bacteroides sp. 224]|uniref:type IA DNA topoisomerase n=1 Tax=Bacteroides sp. 224 TaxID=2302936 RepID=UPI0013D6B45E|nr:type IA DNA topoisomerase [Bacteroides sp. 224]NDV64638.1 type IA DNA topoisomerase [Bacteroides sp. 224]